MGGCENVLNLCAFLFNFFLFFFQSSNCKMLLFGWVFFFFLSLFFGEYIRMLARAAPEIRLIKRSSSGHFSLFIRDQFLIENFLFSNLLNAYILSAKQPQSS